MSATGVTGNCPVPFAAACRQFWSRLTCRIPTIRNATTLTLGPDLSFRS